MAIYSPLRSRRLAAQNVEVLQRLITFQLRQETFGLPLDEDRSHQSVRVHKVTTFDRLYGDANDTGVSLTTYQGQELVVIDVGQKIFGKMPTVLPPASSPPQHDLDDRVNRVNYLLILQSPDDRLVGLPIDSAPSIQSIAPSAFRPLPDIYRQHSNIHCVSSVSADLPDRRSIFLLNATLILEN